MKKILIIIILTIPFLGFRWNGERAPKMKLSDYGFFQGDLRQQIPATGVVPYHLNTPLFSDHAEKLRFVHLPAGSTIPYNDTAVFNFPVGTSLIKTFYYPLDFRDPSKGRRLMETRVLVHEEKGWKALPYIWNVEQTEAVLDVAEEKPGLCDSEYEPV
jgi:hypothetical protein